MGLWQTAYHSLTSAWSGLAVTFWAADVGNVRIGWSMAVHLNSTMTCQYLNLSLG